MGSSSQLKTISWVFGFSDKGREEFNALDQSIKNQIKKKIDKILSTRTNPMNFFKRLTGNLSHLHSLRVGPYRVVCEIDGSRYVIIAVHIAHRREVYD
jgi:mRNA interferase RelE/StbE